MRLEEREVERGGKGGKRERERERKRSIVEQGERRI